MNTKNIGLGAFLLGLVLALLTVFINLGDWTTQVLIILGILAGVFHEPLRENMVKLGVAYLVLLVVGSSMQALIAIGPYITDITTAWVGFLGPVTLTVFMLWGTPLLFGKRGA